MSNAWFRLYHEFATDPKVQMLSEVDQRRYVMLLCLRCSNGDETLHDDEIAFQLRISDDEWDSTKQRLLQRGLIDDACNPCGWEKRQFSSDSSTARVSEHRARKKQGCNVTETPPDTDTDTDTEKKKKTTSSKKKQEEILEAEFSEVWEIIPKRPGDSRSSALKAYRARREKHSYRVIFDGAKAYADFCDAQIRSDPGWNFQKGSSAFLGPDEFFLSDWSDRPRAAKPPPEPVRQSARTVYS